MAYYTKKKIEKTAQEEIIVCNQTEKCILLKSVGRGGGVYTSKECWGCILLKSVGVYTSKECWGCILLKSVGGVYF